MFTIGWREWVSIPDWEIENIKVKVDTGARTSSIHAEEINLYDKGDSRWVQFIICPWQESRDNSVTIDAPVLSFREVKSSSGESELRPVVTAPLKINNILFDAELTLTDRDAMGFRMLLGREAIKSRFLVNPGISYLSGRPSKKIRDKNRGKS